MLSKHWRAGGRWAHRCFDDGLHQVCFPTEKDGLMIERIAAKGAGRWRWHLVRRDPTVLKTYGENNNYPPIIGGPFPTLDAAKVAYLMERGLSRE